MGIWNGIKGAAAGLTRSRAQRQAAKPVTPIYRRWWMLLIMGIIGVQAMSAYDRYTTPPPVPMTAEERAAQAASEQRQQLQKQKDREALGLVLQAVATLTSSPPLMAGIPSTGRPCPTASACADSFSKAPTSRTPMRDGELPEIFVLGSNCLMAKEEFGTVVATEGSLPPSRPSRPVRSDLGLNPEACRSIWVRPARCAGASRSRTASGG